MRPESQAENEPRTMKRRVRFLGALSGRQPDRVPMFDFLFQRPLYESLIGRRPENYNTHDVVACALALDHDAVWLRLLAPDGWQPQWLDDMTYVDEWGTVFRRSDSSWPFDAPVDYPIRDRADLTRYRLPDPTLPGRTDDLLRFWQTSHDDLALTAGVSGPFTRAWHLLGYEHICYALYDDPELFTEILRLSVEYAKEAARRCVAAGCHAIWLMEDLGDNSRGFMRLAHFEQYYYPYLSDLADYLGGLNLPVILHSDGHIKIYLPLLAQTKISAIHPLQRTAGMDLRWAKENYGRRFCLIGNIDSSRTLPYGTPADVVAEVREAIDIAAPGGGYVLASDHSLHDAIPVENILALFRAGREYGR
jgi:uroporphyrinogen decarboxylase